MPVLTGWAAVPGASLADVRPWLLFAVMFWWQPPHFWVLAMKYREDYARAGLPMLPVTHGNDETTRQILLYSYLLLSVVLLSTVGLDAGWLYTVVSLGLTAGWLRYAHRLRRTRTVARCDAAVPLLDRLPRGAVHRRGRRRRPVADRPPAPAGRARS